jgi:hypothetical protein
MDESREVAADGRSRPRLEPVFAEVLPGSF